MTTCNPYGGGSCGSMPPAPVTTTTSIGTPVHHTPDSLAFTGGDVLGVGGLALLGVVAGLSISHLAERVRRTSWHGRR